MEEREEVGEESVGRTTDWQGLGDEPRQRTTKTDDVSDLGRNFVGQGQAKEEEQERLAFFFFDVRKEQESECRRDEASVRLLFHDVDQISGTTLPRHYCIRVRMKQNENRLHNTWFRTTIQDRRTRTNTDMDEAGRKKEIPKSRATTETHDHRTLLSFFFIFFQPRNRPELWIRKGSRRGSSEREIRNFLGEAKYTQRKRAGKQ